MRAHIHQLPNNTLIQVNISISIGFPHTYTYTHTHIGNIYMYTYIYIYIYTHGHVCDKTHAYMYVLDVWRGEGKKTKTVINKTQMRQSQTINFNGTTTSS